MFKPHKKQVKFDPGTEIKSSSTTNFKSSQFRCPRQNKIYSSPSGHEKKSFSTTHTRKQVYTDPYAGYK